MTRRNCRSQQNRKPYEANMQGYSTTTKKQLYCRKAQKGIIEIKSKPATKRSVRTIVVKDIVVCARHHGRSHAPLDRRGVEVVISSSVRVERIGHLPSGRAEVSRRRCARRACRIRVECGVVMLLIVARDWNWRGVTRGDCSHWDDRIVRRGEVGVTALCQRSIGTRA